MALTILMAGILIVTYLLMLGLVKFTENIIAAPESASADDTGTTQMRTADTRP